MHTEDKERKSRVYEIPVKEAISLEAFESSVREFLFALNVAGIAQPPPPDVEHILDLSAVEVDHQPTFVSTRRLGRRDD
jgi:hypothetical protein